MLLQVMAVLLLGSCARTGEAQQFYVLAPHGKGEAFIPELKDMLEADHYEVASGSLTSDRGRTRYVLDAGNWSVLLHAENVTLSGQEDAARCGAYEEPHPDPGQFWVYLRPKWSMSTDTGKQTVKTLTNQLQSRGYQVTSKPTECSGS